MITSLSLQITTQQNLQELKSSGTSQRIPVCSLRVCVCTCALCVCAVVHECMHVVRGITIFTPGWCYGPKTDMILYLYPRTIIIAKSIVTNVISHSEIKVDRRSCVLKITERESCLRHLTQNTYKSLLVSRLGTWALGQSVWVQNQAPSFTQYVPLGHL